MRTQRGREITETGIEKLGMGVLSSSILSYLLALACLLACLDMRTCVACVWKRIKRGLWLCVCDLDGVWLDGWDWKGGGLTDWTGLDWRLCMLRM